MNLVVSFLLAIRYTWTSDFYLLVRLSVCGGTYFIMIDVQMFILSLPLIVIFASLFI
jgi:hypothetical protein